VFVSANGKVRLQNQGFDTMAYDEALEKTIIR
jgi:hypothetical protein